MNKLKKLCAKSSIKPELTYIKVKDGYMEATDSFRWAKIKNTVFKDGYYHQKNRDYVRTMNFPDVSIIVDTAKKENNFTFKVNRKYLIETLEAIDKGDSFDSVELHINIANTNRPLYITNDNGEALVMPLNK